MVNRRIHREAFEMAQFGQRDHHPGGGRDRQLAKAAQIAPHCQRHLQVDEFRLKATLTFHVAQLEAPHSHFQLTIDRFNRHTPARSLVAVHDEAPGLMVRLQKAVDINDGLGTFKQGNHIARNLAAGLRVGAIDFRDHGLQHRRAGRHLDHFDPGTQRSSQRRQQFTGLIGQLGRGFFAGRPMHQLHLDVPLPRHLPQVGMAHQTVEVERAGSAHIALRGHHFGDGQDLCDQLLGHIRGNRQGRAFGQVDGHVELGLVVLGQHLDRHTRGVKQRQAKREHDQKNHRKYPAGNPLGNQRNQGFLE